MKKILSLFLALCLAVAPASFAGTVAASGVTLSGAVVNPKFRKIPLPDIWENGSWTSDGVFYGARSGNLYKSTDFLKTKSASLDTVTNAGLGPVVKVTAAGSIIWGYAPTLRRSINGGTSWATVLTNTGGTSWWPSSLIQSPTTGTLFVSCYDTSTKKVFKSVDDGQTWTETLNPTIMAAKGLTYVHFHMCAVAPNGWVYASTGENGTDRHNLISKDDGVTWTVIGTGNTTSHPTALMFFYDASQNIIGLWGADYVNPGYIQRSTNNSTALSYTTVDTCVYSGQPTDVWTFCDFGGGTIMSFYSPDQFGIAWPYYLVTENYGLTWTRCDWDQYSSGPYSGVTFSSENGYKKWFMVAETLNGWASKTRSFLITYGGDPTDIGR